MSKVFESSGRTQNWLIDHNIGTGQCSNIVWEGYVAICADTGEVLDERPLMHVLPIERVGKYNVMCKVNYSKYVHLKSILEKKGIKVSVEQAMLVSRIMGRLGLRMAFTNALPILMALEGKGLEEYRKIAKALGAQVRVDIYKKVLELVRRQG